MAVKKPRRNKNGKILCSYCGRYLGLNQFYTSGLNKFRYKCKKCHKSYQKSRRGNINLLIDSAYSRQIYTNVPVHYSWEEFTAWAISDDNFMKLYQSWIALDCNTNRTPAVVRIDSRLPWKLSNIKAVSASHARLMNIRKRQKTVAKIDSDGKEIIKYANARVAAKHEGISRYQNIHRACKVPGMKAGGFCWRYVEARSIE